MPTQNEEKQINQQQNRVGPEEVQMTICAQGIKLQDVVLTRGEDDME